MNFRPLALTLMISPIALGQPAAAPAQPAATAAQSPAASELPGVEAAIPESVKALGEPTPFDFPGGIRMAVTAATDKAQAHVNQGLNHLHGGWEFEASRHFAAAMREDPECLMAHWGMVMCVLTPSPETLAVRSAVTTRFVHLMEDPGNGTALERGYASGLMKYLEAGPSAAGAEFGRVAAGFPNDMQAAIFAALFSRDGYNEFGKPTLNQENAEKSLLALCGKFPDSPIPLNALLTIRAEAPDLRPSVELARKLAAMAPDYPPYRHLLGHYEWRAGNHPQAAAAFAAAAAGFHAWMTAEKVAVADCPEWIKAGCYHAVALASKGDFDNAYKLARDIAATPLPEKRLTSPGARMLLWDAVTLPARILLHRGMRGNADEALHSLPTPKSLLNTHNASLAYWWIDGLRFALEARRLMDAGKPAEAAQVVTAFTRHGEQMVKGQRAAGIGYEKSSWLRGFHAVEILASELRGQLAMTAPKKQRGPAFNWFSAANDRQRPTSSMMPPALLTPMGIHLGEYYLDAGQPAEAVAAYQDALVRFPNDLKALEGLKLAQEKAGQPTDAAATAKQIEALRAP